LLSVLHRSNHVQVAKLAANIAEIWGK